MHSNSIEGDVTFTNWYFFMFLTPQQRTLKYNPQMNISCKYKSEILLQQHKIFLTESKIEAKLKLG